MSEGGAGGGSGVHPASGDRRSDDGSESVVREDPAPWQWFLDDYGWMGEDPEVERGDLQRAIRSFVAWASADRVDPEAEHQHQRCGDDRQHHVLKGEIHVVTPPGR